MSDQSDDLGGIGGDAAWREPPTAVDPGRGRPPEAEATVLDPGRDAPPRRLDGLPPLLAARFTIGQPLHGARSEAEVYLVKERTTEETRVVRLYPEHRHDQQVVDFVANQEHRHVVRILERGAEAGFRYEVMEHLGGGDLVALRENNPTGLDAQELTELVRQIAAALAAVHAAGFVHRDVKPANLVLRSQRPVDAVLIDFGVAVQLPDGEPDIMVPVPDGALYRPGTLRYTPPEYQGGGLVSRGFDWWSLGMTVRELALGRAPFAGLDDRGIGAAVARTIAFEEITDPRIRLLCRGLLTHDDVRRWGEDEVWRWLAGENPPVAAQPTELGEEPAEVAEPFVYQEVAYRNRALLAADLTRTWETAAALFFGGRNSARLNALEVWLRQYPEFAVGLDRGGRRAPANVRLLRLLRQISPAHPPIYRQTLVSRARLPQLARAAANGEGNFPEIVAELYDYRLLPLLASGAPDPGSDGGGGGDGLDVVDARWRALVEHRDDLVAAIPDDARDQLERIWRTARPQVLAMCLWAVVANDSTRRRVRDGLRALARRANVDWFADLVDPLPGGWADTPNSVWVAYLMRDHVEGLIEEREQAARVERERGRWLAANRARREWARTQNRPLALGWAVAGVCVLGAVCALLVAVGDLAGQVAPSTILDAWVATVFGGTAALGVEAALGWEIGGRFHPGHSLLGAGFIALGRLARTVARRRFALGACAITLGAGYVLTVYLPVVTPVLAGAGAIISAVPRYLSWRRRCAEEERLAEQAAQRIGLAA